MDRETKSIRPLITAFLCLCSYYIVFLFIGPSPTVDPDCLPPAGSTALSSLASGLASITFWLLCDRWDSSFDDLLASSSSSLLDLNQNKEKLRMLVYGINTTYFLSLLFSIFSIVCIFQLNNGYMICNNRVHLGILNLSALLATGGAVFICTYKYLLEMWQGWTM